MTRSSVPSSSAEDQAALWAARLDGSELSAADRAELAAWLAADPDHRALLSAYCQFSADLEQRLPLLAGIREGLAEIPTATHTTRPVPRSHRPLWAGAALTAAAVAAVFFWPGRAHDRIQDYSAPVGGRHAVTLDDGSRLELNAGSVATVALTDDSRHVRLSGGEGFFQVTPDPARPFHVETPAGSVRVTGTQFNVRAETDFFEVTVLEGSVQARPGGAGGVRSLKAGDRLRTADGNLAFEHLSSKALADTLAWRTGHIVFNDTPLRDALARFARHHGRNLSVSSGAADLRVGGVHSIDDLDGFLATIEEMLPVRVTRGLDGAVHVEALPSS